MGQTSMRAIRYDRLTPLAAANVVLGGNWGGGASVVIGAGSNDVRGKITINVGTLPGSNPTWTLTFVEPWSYVGSASSGPFVIVVRDGSDPAPSLSSVSATAFTVTQGGPIQASAPITYFYRVTG